MENVNLIEEISIRTWDNNYCKWGENQTISLMSISLPDSPKEENYDWSWWTDYAQYDMNDMINVLEQYNQSNTDTLITVKYFRLGAEKPFFSIEAYESDILRKILGH